MGWPVKHFWSIGLSSNIREVEWPPIEQQQQKQGDDDDSDDSSDDLCRQKLDISMVTLGQGVSKTEEQVVEVKTVTPDKQELRIPLVNMKSSQHNTILTKATFTDRNTVLFKLVSGDGPIYLSGCVRENRNDDNDSWSSLSDDTNSLVSESDDDSDESVSEKESKRKAVSKAGSKRKSTGSQGTEGITKKTKKQPAKDQRKGGKTIKKQ